MRKNKKQSRKELLSKLSEEDQIAIKLGYKIMRQQGRAAAKKRLIRCVEKILNFIFDLED